MALDLSRAHAAAAAHTDEVQRLLESNSKHVAAAKAAADNEKQAQAEIDSLTAALEAQTATLKAFNDANPA
jgi:hypothetical protein